MGKPLLDVLGGRMPARRPIWFMRQAGRYLPEYRAVREKAGSFLDLCYNPELAAEVTAQPLRRFDLDAAILFADILVVPHAMGLGVRFEEGEGPIIERVLDLDGVRRLGAVGATDQTRRVCETVARVRAGLAPTVALIGFCGGPWTVASYMVEGKSSDRVAARLAAYSEAEWFRMLIDRLVEESVDYLCAQIEAGAEAVQIFDSWAGELAGELGDRFVIEPLGRMVDAVRVRHPQVPVIVFARGFGVRQLEVARRTGASCLGIETELPMSWAGRELAPQAAVQGNLDPVALWAPDDMLERETQRICGSIARSRHVFNLGHGIRQGTDAAKIERVIRAVREFDAG